MDIDTTIPTVGPGRTPSPISSRYFTTDEIGVLLDTTVPRDGRLPPHAATFQQAGPRRCIHFDPARTKAAIVTCGGLCPGLNDVIRALTMVLWYHYGVRDIVGLRYGYEGVVHAYGHAPMPLEPEMVEDIHNCGGTILGSSRGPQTGKDMVDFLVDQGIDILFTIGGDGTQRGGLDIMAEAHTRGVPISVIGIPKTIDNDVQFTDRTFGFETAVALSRHPIESAHMEAKGVQNGVGLVKLMGRDSGFVAAYASLASGDVNLCLIPEVSFKLGDVTGFLEERLERKSHAVIVVAEGAGQELVASEGEDASGNRKRGDIGTFLKHAISAHFEKLKKPVAVKYIDPSYTIRSAAATADDSVFCFQLAENAVHAAMSGKTGMVVASWNGHFVHIPTLMATAARKKIDPAGPLWNSVLANTGQPF